MDNGVYTLDAILYLLGHPRPLTVSGTADNTFGRSPDGAWDPQRFSVEDFGTAYVRLEGGVTLFFAHSWAINFAEQWLVRRLSALGSRRVRGRTASRSVSIPSGREPRAAAEPRGVRQFVEAIRHDRPSPIPGETFLYTNVIFDGIYASSRQGREVAVEVPGR